MKRALEQGGEDIADEPVAKRARTLTYPPPERPPLTTVTNALLSGWSGNVYMVFSCDLRTTLYHHEIVCTLRDANNAVPNVSLGILRYLIDDSPLPASIFGKYLAHIPPDQYGTWTRTLMVRDAMDVLPRKKPADSPPPPVAEQPLATATDGITLMPAPRRSSSPPPLGPPSAMDPRPWLERGLVRTFPHRQLLASPSSRAARKE